jgi:hypothetical protein
MATGSTITSSLSIQYYNRQCEQKKKESAVVEPYWLCLGSQNITHKIHNVSVCGTSELAGKMWRWNEGIYSSLDLLSSITYPSSTAAATLLAIFFFLYL